MKKQLEAFTAEINRHFFLREYSFAENVFKPDHGTEVEAADHLIALPEAFLVFQIRSAIQIQSMIKLLPRNGSRRKCSRSGVDSLLILKNT